MSGSPQAAARHSNQNPVADVVDVRHLRLLAGSARPDDQERKEANATLAAGLGIGAFGIASLAVFGSTCPLCVAAAPVLVSLGLYKRRTASRRR
jgi:hypothetical protein